MGEPSAWSFTITVPVGVLIRLAGAYVVMGALLIIPADRVLWALYRRRGFKVGSYRQWVASKAPRWYRSGILRWPSLVISVTRASFRVDRLAASEPLANFMNQVGT